MNNKSKSKKYFLYYKQLLRIKNLNNIKFFKNNNNNPFIRFERNNNLFMKNTLTGCSSNNYLWSFLLKSVFFFFITSTNYNLLKPLVNFNLNYYLNNIPLHTTNNTPTGNKKLLYLTKINYANIIQNHYKVILNQPEKSITPSGIIQTIPNYNSVFNKTGLNNQGLNSQSLKFNNYGRLIYTFLYNNFTYFSYEVGLKSRSDILNFNFQN